MRLEDASDVAELCGQLGYPAQTHEVERRFDTLAKLDDAQVFVAENASGRVVGWIHVYIVHFVDSDAQGELGGFVIADGMRGKGVGRALLAAAERWTLQAGCQAVRVRSQIMREAAHGFYEHLGYAYVKTQKNFHKVIRDGTV
jgi:GNAT superfamily N-acetyltransferase